MLIVDKTMTTVAAVVKQAEENQKLWQRLIEPLEAIHSSIEQSKRMVRELIPTVNVPYTIPLNLPDGPDIDGNLASDICKSSKPKRRIGFAEWPDESEGVEY